MTNNTFVPFVSGKKYVSDEDKFFNLIRDSKHQERNKEDIVRHPLLDRAAKYKAQDMADNDYFSHTSPDGVSANENVRMTGYELPDGYGQNGNNVESLVIGGGSPEDSANALYLSASHRDHVYGQMGFYREQLCLGVGKANAKKDNRHIYVFLSAPCE